MWRSFNGRTEERAIKLTFKNFLKHFGRFPLTKFRMIFAHLTYPLIYRICHLAFKHIFSIDSGVHLLSITIFCMLCSHLFSTWNTFMQHLRHFFSQCLSPSVCIIIFFALYRTLLITVGIVPNANNELLSLRVRNKKNCTKFHDYREFWHVSA